MFFIKKTSIIKLGGFIILSVFIFSIFFSNALSQTFVSPGGGTFPGASGGNNSGGIFVDENVTAPMELVSTPGGTFHNLIGRAMVWISYAVYLVIFIAFLLFLVGILRYITGGADEEKRREARNLIIYGIVGLFVMVSIWALVYFVGSVLGIRPGGIVDLPVMPGSTTGQNLILDGTDTRLVEIIKKAGGIIVDLVFFVMALAMLMLLWGITRYITSGAEEEKKAEARRLVTYGVLGLFVMASIWAIVYFVGSSIGIAPGGGIIIPQITNNDKTDIGVGGEALTKCEPWNTEKTGNKMPNVSFKNLVCSALKVLNPIPPILMALAMLYFFWGIAKYMNSAGDAEELKSGRNTIIYGIIGLFVMAAMWALVYLIQSEFGVAP